MLRSDLVDAKSISSAATQEGVDNAKTFFNHFGKSELLKAFKISDLEIELLYSLFRNKIAHNLLPKHQLGVCLNDSNDVHSLLVSINNTPSLNVNFLSVYVVNSFTILKEELKNDSALVSKNIKSIEEFEVKKVRNIYNNNSSSDKKAKLESWLPNFSNLLNNQFNNCSFIDSELLKNNIGKCDFTEANFSGAEIIHGYFESNIVNSTVWKFTSFKNTGISDVIFEGTLEDCHFENCGFYNVKFQNATIVNTFFKYNEKFKRVQFIDCKVDKITYAFLKNNQANLTGITLIE